MQTFLLAAILVVGALWLVRQFASATPGQSAVLTRKLGGAACIAAAGFLALRGAFAVAAPLFLFGLGLMGKSLVFPNGFPWERKTPGQRSRVTTQIIGMELDHDSGRMDGEVLTGPFKGRKLSSLSDGQLKDTHRLCMGARDQSLSLLEAWLDRSKPSWRQTWGGEGAGKSAQPSNSKMSQEEALAVLGLKAGASSDDVRAAHRRLMKDFHPDKGGSDYLATKINQAKDRLLQD